jgi:hypothetical protein
MDYNFIVIAFGAVVQSVANRQMGSRPIRDSKEQVMMNLYFKAGTFIHRKCEGVLCR